MRSEMDIKLLILVLLATDNLGRPISRERTVKLRVVTGSNSAPIAEGPKRAVSDGRETTPVNEDLPVSVDVDLSLAHGAKPLFALSKKDVSGKYRRKRHFKPYDDLDAIIARLEAINFKRKHPDAVEIQVDRHVDLHVANEGSTNNSQQQGLQTDDHQSVHIQQSSPQEGTISLKLENKQPSDGQADDHQSVHIQQDSPQRATISLNLQSTHSSDEQQSKGKTPDIEEDEDEVTEDEDEVSDDDEDEATEDEDEVSDDDEDEDTEDEDEVSDDDEDEDTEDEDEVSDDDEGEVTEDADEVTEDEDEISEDEDDVSEDEDETDNEDNDNDEDEESDDEAGEDKNENIAGEKEANKNGSKTTKSVSKVSQKTPKSHDVNTTSKTNNGEQDKLIVNIYKEYHTSGNENINNDQNDKTENAKDKATLFEKPNIENDYNELVELTKGIQEYYGLLQKVINDHKAKNSINVNTPKDQNKTSVVDKPVTVTKIVKIKQQVR